MVGEAGGGTQPPPAGGRGDGAVSVNLICENAGGYGERSRASRSLARSIWMPVCSCCRRSLRCWIERRASIISCLAAGDVGAVPVVAGGGAGAVVVVVPGTAA